MKFYYPKDMDGNIIGFKTPESQVYDATGKSLTDKLADIQTTKLDKVNSGYIKSLSISGKTITYTRGDDTTGTLVTQDTTYTLASFGVTATAAELNTLDGITATVTELNYCDGVTSNIQTQLNGKAATSHGTHVSYSTTAPLVAGTASVGSAATVSRSDHVHPAQTTVSGNAGSATQLATARTIQTNLGSTSAASFNGTANVTPGVTGTLPVANGGTGATTAAAARTNLGAMAATPACIELYPGSTSAGNGGYIDFHFNNSSADYTTRLIESTSGTLTCVGNFTATKVYNAVWNDYAEWFEKEDVTEEFEPGDILTWGENGVTKTTSFADNLVVGVFSDSYGHIIGGEEKDDMEENHAKFVPVGLAGRLNVKVKGKVKRGDLIVSSDTPGVGVVPVGRPNPGTIIGKALANKDTDEIGTVKIMIMLA